MGLSSSKRRLSLLTLPTELLVQVVQWLDVRGVVSVLGSCRQLRIIALEALHMGVHFDPTDPFPIRLADHLSKIDQRGRKSKIVASPYISLCFDFTIPEGWNFSKPDDGSPVQVYVKTVALTSRHPRILAVLPLLSQVSALSTAVLQREVVIIGDQDHKDAWTVSVYGKSIEPSASPIFSIQNTALAIEYLQR